MKKTTVNDFLVHLNDQCNGIQFTLERESENRSIAFLDCNVTFTNNRFVLKIHRKPTHSDGYLHFNSSHPICMKKAVVQSLVYRAIHLCSNSTDTEKELERLKAVLKENGYPLAVIDQTVQQIYSPRREKQQQQPKATVRIPYRPQTAESVRKILGDYNIRTVFNLDNTLRKQLVRPKDCVQIMDRTNCVYKIQCADCPAVYIGQTSRQLKVRLNEHKRQARTMLKNSEQLKKLTKDSVIVLHTVAKSYQIRFDEAYFYNMD